MVEQLLGGLIVDHINWPWIFAINVPIEVLAFVIICIALPKSRTVAT